MSRDQTSIARSSRPVVLLAELLVSALALFGIVWTSFKTGFASNEVVAIWPAAGFGVWLALRYGWLAFPSLFAGPLLYSALFQSEIVQHSLAPIAGNAFAICLCVDIFRRLTGDAPPLQSLKSILLLILVPGLGHSIIAALVGAATVQQIFGLAAPATWNLGWRWLFSDFTGVVLMAPLCIVVMGPLLQRGLRWSREELRHLARAALITTIALFMIVLASSRMPDALGQYPIVLLTMPLCIWLAFNSDIVTSIGFLALTVLGALGLTLARVGDVGAEGFLAVQLYGVVVMCTSLVVHAISHERREAVEALARQRESLEKTVAARTAELRDKIHAYEVIKTELEKQATTDSLTGLANRRAFMARLSKAYAAMLRRGDSMCLVMFDLDHFKTVNDTYGHSIGDELLARVGEILAKHARSGTDFPARLGGEEFACLLEHTHLEGGVIAAERILEKLRSCVIPTSAGPISFTASAGVAVMDRELPSIDHALVAADEALYEAKRSGRDRVCSHDPLTVTISLKVASRIAG